MTKATSSPLSPTSSSSLRRVRSCWLAWLFDCMEQSMSRGEKIEIRGFGRFTVRQYRAYDGRNPRNRRNRSRQAQASGLLQGGQGAARAGEQGAAVDWGSRCVVRTSAILPSPNRICKMADNSRSVNHTHLHTQTIPLYPYPATGPASSQSFSDLPAETKECQKKSPSPQLPK